MINYYSFPISKSKREISALMNEECVHEIDYRGSLYQPIRWIEDKVFDSGKEATDYIERIDRHDYDQIAVKYKEYSKPKTKEYENLLKRQKEIEDTLFERKTKIHYSSATTKSSYVTCKECGSKLSVKHISSNQCPLCRHDLRPQSVLDSIETSGRMLRDINKKIAAAEKKSGKSSTYWLVKIEYHV